MNDKTNERVVIEKKKSKLCFISWSFDAQENSILLLLFICLHFSIYCYLNDSEMVQFFQHFNDNKLGWRRMVIDDLRVMCKTHTYKIHFHFHLFVIEE